MNRSKAKGTAAEAAVCRYLSDRGWPVERRAPSGADDRGDVAGLVVRGDRWVLEVKAEARLNLPQYLRELEAERVRDGARFGAVWVKRRGRGSPADWYVVLDGHMFAKVLDSFKDCGAPF